MTAAFRIKGTTADVTACDCCNRRGLRKTVALVPLDRDGMEDGEVTYYGTGCAAKALRTSSHSVRKIARAADLQAVIEQRAQLRDRAAFALPLLERSRALLVTRMEAGEDPATVATGHVNRLGVVMGRYTPARRQEAEAQAREAFATGGLRALLAVYDRYGKEITRVSRMDPEVFTY
ncbi:hypothetical protein [Streptomyces sp. MNU103]|uniref:hypothetical protein n=1 Tax=Streptomyces sp. MNU103 TaxID=2560024 RepID=UPI001E4166C2|nr:hypothetical protein [Streptomyces sp. MNU103]